MSLQSPVSPLANIGARRLPRRVESSPCTSTPLAHHISLNGLNPMAHDINNYTLDHLLSPDMMGENEESMTNSPSRRPGRLSCPTSANSSAFGKLGFQIKSPVGLGKKDSNLDLLELTEPTSPSKFSKAPRRLSCTPSSRTSSTTKRNKSPHMNQYFEHLGLLPIACELSPGGALNGSISTRQSHSKLPSGLSFDSDSYESCEENNLMGDEEEDYGPSSPTKCRSNPQILVKNRLSSVPSMSSDSGRSSNSGRSSSSSSSNDGGSIYIIDKSGSSNVGGDLYDVKAAGDVASTSTSTSTSSINAMPSDLLLNQKIDFLITVDHSIAEVPEEDEAEPRKTIQGIPPLAFLSSLHTAPQSSALSSILTPSTHQQIGYISSAESGPMDDKEQRFQSPRSSGSAEELNDRLAELRTPFKQTLLPPHSRLMITPKATISSKYCGATAPYRSTIVHLFEAPHFPQQRIVTPAHHQPSRIPRPAERTTHCNSAPGIRYPDSLTLTYANSRKPKTHNVFDSLLAWHLPTIVDPPHVPMTYSSPYPRITKAALHSHHYYSRTLSRAMGAAEKIEQQALRPVPVTPKTVRSPHAVRFDQMHSKPKTCQTTASKLKKSISRTLTTPMSPKLRTAARAGGRICQGHRQSPKKHQHGAQTTISKKQAAVRRRPSPGPVRRMAATPNKELGSQKYAGTPSSTLRGVPIPRPKFATPLSKDKKPQIPPNSSSKPALSYTTSLSDFKQPLAAVAPTLEPSRTEIDKKLKRPLPTPKLQNTPLKIIPKPQPTPTKMLSFNEATGPTHRRVEAFNTETGDYNEPLSILRSRPDATK